jgi:hypothetical protein
MIPVWRDVEVLIVGSSSRAVEAALEVRRRGMSALVVADLSYFGEESAGTLTCAPVLPGAVKRGLEESLLRAGVPFLYLVRPVSLLRDADGRVAGALLAARTSLLAVTCRSVVDATRFGTVWRLAGAKAVPVKNAPAKVAWNVIATGAPEGAEELPALFRREDKTFRLFRVWAERGADALSREHAARAALQDGRLLATADLLQDSAEETFSPVPDIYAGAGPVEPRPVRPVVPVKGTDWFAPAFLRRALGGVDAGPAGLPVLGRFDVVVAGGGTGGAPAGIAAARAGARTVVLEAQHALGGVGTIGLISCYWYGNRVGFTRELDDAVMRLDEESRAKKGVSWSPELKSGVYHRLLREAGGTAWLGSYAFGVRKDGDRVTGVLVSTPYGAGVLETNSVIDATGNADIAAAAGAPCRVIGADHVAVQGTGLSPRAWPGIRGQNSDHTFVDETDPEGITHAFVNARAKFPNDFDTSPLVNTRERRQIVGDLVVSPLDILAHRTFPDTVVTAISNFDTHGYIIHPVFMVAVPDHGALQAHVPFRCLLPKGVEGVLVVGLGLSAHRDALPVIRMQADVQNMGYAAGLAAVMAGKGRFRDLDVRALQRRLVGAGILAPEVAAQEDSFPVPESAVREALADLASAKNVAVLFAFPGKSRALLARDPRPEAALILGLMGGAEAAPALAEAVRGMAWDAGWNFRGMGQFGASMSRLDAFILALARTRQPEAVSAIGEKIRQLGSDAFFSHCRVASVAAALLPELAGDLAALLDKPGMTGHAQLDTLAVIGRANGDRCENEARNLALRELHLACGLFMAGDSTGRARAILETYAMDLRGPFARHARAVLAGDTVGELA